MARPRPEIVGSTNTFHLNSEADIARDDVLTTLGLRSVKHCDLPCNHFSVFGSTRSVFQVDTFSSAPGNGRSTVPQAAFSHDSKLIAVSGDTNNRGKGGDVVIWEIASQKVVARFGQELDEINSIDFSPDGKSLASTTKDYMDSRVYLWNLRRKIGE